jgi:hypothetical protein
MKSTTVEPRNIEGAEAAAGWAGGHTLVVEQPNKKCRTANSLRQGVPASIV